MWCGFIVYIYNASELKNSSNYLPAEKEQLESVMAIAKSSVQYWAYGNGHFKAALATEDEIPTWAERDIPGAATAIYGGYADYAYLLSGFNPIVGWGNHSWYGCS